MGEPVVVLTHEPPAGWPRDTPFTFVTDGFERAGPRSVTQAST